MNRFVFIIQIFLLLCVANHGQSHNYKVIDAIPWSYAGIGNGFLYVVERNDSLFKIVSKTSDSVYYCHIQPDSIYDMDLYCENSPFNRGENKVVPSLEIRGYDGVDVDSRFHWSSYSIKRVSKGKGLPIPSSLKKYGSLLIDIRDSSVLYHFPGDTMVRIPNGVKRLSPYVFSGDSLIRNVILPESVVSIGEYAFENCWRLERIHMSENIISIGRDAFSNCFNLYDFSIPKHLELIRLRTFYRCLSLRKIVLPQSLKDIEEDAFEGCACLKIVVNNSYLKLKKKSSENGCVVKYCRRIID